MWDDWLRSSCRWFTLSVKQHLFPLFPQISLKMNIRMFSLSCFNTRCNFILVSWEVCEKMKPRGFVLRWPSDPRQGQGQWKWCKMVEVNGAYKHGRYVKNWLKSLRGLSNFKVFATQDGRTDGQTNTTHYMVPYGTHMDKKKWPTVQLQQQFDRKGEPSQIPR